MRLDRRTMLRTSGAGALVGGPFAGFAAMPAAAARPGGTWAPELVPTRDRRDGKVRLHLPPGFSYRSFHDTEEPVVLDDGTVLPGRHDGMGAFPGRKGTTVLVRNHEIPVADATEPFGPARSYDEGTAGGGTTTVRVTGDGRVLSSFTSLSGTIMNCSGGIMPWGSWVTCEETVNGPDVGPDFTGTPNTGLQKPHGYVFEVPAGGRSKARPVRGAGRFAHEAVSFDPKRGSLYLTEDNFGFASGFYRYTPRRNPMKCGYLDDEGVLEMLAVKGRPNLHLEGHQRRGATYDVRWVRIDEPDFLFDHVPGQPAPTTNDEALVFVGDQGRAKGAASFSRLEGQVYDRGVVYFTSTEGGGAPEPGTANPEGYGNGFGQVWGYDTRRQTLTCVFQSPDQSVLDFPDNVTTSRRGTLVVCEDSSGDNYLRGLSPKGRLWDIALNRLTSGTTDEDRFADEFAGSTFSTDGRTLFVNIQAAAGMTFAIWGPWGRIGV
ncbi:PhoX family protein [Nocardioides caldifontis]|uniref:PhoX family protein n=1 Tax=Nocardioides caldifontis TaxID=2588938 RepID=UPI0011E044F2|nr:alkaline phosphatase PhoX [Nocardioides caldifontis]